jgi:ABC-type glycerol-3-phosphate transport system substrate-binding protein
VTTPVTILDEPLLETRTVPTRTAVPETDQPIVLTIWAPEEFAPGSGRGGDVLESQIAAFEAEHPDVKLQYVRKAPFGKGGLIDWITQLDELMPQRLPDAVIVDARQLDRLLTLGRVRPLNHELPSGAFWDLFLPAQIIARQGGFWSNFPLVLDMEHLVFDSTRVQVPPATWDDVLSSRNEFAFAADSTDTFLFQYVESGGSLSPEEHPAFDANVMQAILEYFQRARANGNLSEAVAMMKSARDVLPLFLSGQVPMAQIRARDFMIERARMPNAEAAPIPTRIGRPGALVSAWSFVILTDDPTRARAAAEYLSWLLDEGRLGEWARSAHMLPASKSAFAESIERPEYAELLWALLQDARVSPGLDRLGPYAEAWHTAVAAVLNGEMAPDDAAFRAIESVSQ